LKRKEDRRRYTAPKPVQPKAYKQKLVMAAELEDKIRLLMLIMTALWNKGVEQAELWFAQKKQEAEKPENERVKIPTVSPFSFNIWLKGIRDIGESVVLSDGRTFKLAEVSVDIERQVLSKVASGYKAFFEARKNGDTEVKRPMLAHPDSLQTLSWSAQNLKVKNGTLIVPGFTKERGLEIPFGGVINKPCGDNQTRLSSYLADSVSGRQVRYANINWKRGKFLVSFVVGLPVVPAKIEKPVFYRAIDLGAGDYAVTDSDGSEFLIPARRPDKYHQAQIKNLDARKNSKRLRTARQRQFERQSNQLLSFQRKLASVLVEDKVHCIVVGRSKIRLGLSQSEDGSPKQHYGVQNTGNLSRLMRFIEQKCEERGVKFVELPDPPREGALDDPESKFRASRKLLSEALKGTPMSAPDSFVRKHFLVRQ
jgi:transposase